jgi:hypothetical protein
MDVVISGSVEDKDNQDHRYDPSEINSKRTYANCWSGEINENYALWKIYLKNQPDGVAIKTNVGNLISSLSIAEQDIHIGEVVYDNSTGNNNEYTMALRKIAPYKYENEIRCILLLKKAQKNEIIQVKVSLKEMIQEIYISPFANKWFDELVRQLINDFYQQKLRDDVMIHNSEIKV